MLRARVGCCFNRARGIPASRHPQIKGVFQRKKSHLNPRRGCCGERPSLYTWPGGSTLWAGVGGCGSFRRGAIMAGIPKHTKYNPSPWEVCAPLRLVSVLAFQGQCSPQLVNGWLAVYQQCVHTMGHYAIIKGMKPLVTTGMRLEISR